MPQSAQPTSPVMRLRRWPVLSFTPGTGVGLKAPSLPPVCATPACLCGLPGIASYAFPLRAPIKLQAVPFLGTEHFRAATVPSRPVYSAPTGACRPHPLVGITVPSGGALPTIEGYTESHAIDIRSRIAQVCAKTFEPLDERPGIPSYSVFPRHILTFSETVDCSIGKVRSETLHSGPIPNSSRKTTCSS